MKEEQFVPVAVARSDEQAQEYRELLADHGIEVLVGFDEWEAHGEPDVEPGAMDHGVPVLVLESLLDEASEVIADREGDDDFDPEDEDEEEDDDEEDLDFEIAEEDDTDLYDDEEDHEADPRDEFPDLDGPPHRRRRERRLFLTQGKHRKPNTRSVPRPPAQQPPTKPPSERSEEAENNLD